MSRVTSARKLRGFQVGLFEAPRKQSQWAEEFLKQLGEILVTAKPEDLVNDSPVEKLYLRLAPAEYRKGAGQVFTPPRIARFMASWALDSQPRSLLDPAVGLGVFLTQVIGFSGQPGPSLHGFDIDPVMVEASKAILNRLGLPPARLTTDDFILRSAHDRYDAIVANPPYVRHHTLDYAPMVFQEVGHKAGVHLSRLTNIYGLFLLKSFELLSDRGRYALITPSEFLNADFGISLKRFLLSTGKLSALVLFDHEALVFDGALTTACITMVDRTKDAREPVRLIKVSRIDHLEEVLEVLRSGSSVRFHRNGWKFQVVAPDDLDPSNKWDPLFELTRPRASKRLVPLRQLAATKRGIATGANSYFTLSAEEVGKAGLSEREVKPCITKASSASHPDFTEGDLAEMRQRGKKIFLIDFKQPLSVAARRYVQRGEEQGLHRRYLTAVRSPWYAGEQREPAPILVTVFGRGSFRFVYNRARTANLTAYHCIYPRALDETVIKALMAYLSSVTCAQLLDQEKRVYGDGLIKLEPRDLLNLPVLDVARMRRAEVEALANAFDDVCRASRTTGTWRESREAEQLESLVKSTVGG